jgi:protein SEY1
MEGTDSKERGGEENLGFERKISLFALSMTEVLIVNMWHQDIGRYNASNYSLLKTVFELNLQLFAKHLYSSIFLKIGNQKLYYYLLFVTI